MINEQVTVHATDARGRSAQVKIGNQLVCWKEVDIRIRPDEFIEVTIVVSPDQIDIAALQGSTWINVEERGES